MAQLDHVVAARMNTLLEEMQEAAGNIQEIGAELSYELESDSRPDELRDGSTTILKCIAAIRDILEQIAGDAEARTIVSRNRPFQEDGSNRKI